MMSPRLFSAVPLALALGLALPPTVQAEPESSPQVAPNAAFSEQELRTFAVASLEVEKIVKKFEAQLNSVESPVEQQEIAHQATDELTTAVEQRGLSVDRYNEMVETVSSDPSLTRRVLDYRNESEPQPAD